VTARELEGVLDMKVLVAVKRVVDHHVKVRVLVDGSDVDVASAKMSVNPFDEIAVEEAVRLREAGLASEVLVVSCGVAACQDTLRAALAMGADRAVRVETDVALQPLAVARLLHALCLREQPGLVICGKQAIDDDAAQTGQMLAALLGWPQATNASRVTLTGGRVEVECGIDGGTEVLSLSLPAVLTTDLRLNEPRYASLPGMMKAKKKPLDTVTPAQLGVDVTPGLRTVRVAEPPVRVPGVRVASVEQLLACLCGEGGALRGVLP
jgi:electron transfer flavoprotein beta subunit